MSHPAAAPRAPWTLEGREPYGEADTRAKWFDPKLYAAQRTEEHIRLRCRGGVWTALAGIWFSYLFVTGHGQERASGTSDTIKKIGRAQLAAHQREQSALSTQLEALDKSPGAFLRKVFGSLDGTI